MFKIVKEEPDSRKKIRLNYVNEDSNMDIELSREQAAAFLFAKQGLTGDYRFEGKKGILDYIRQAGCVQYDAVDVCGRNADLVLQSRVKGYRTDMLSELLYVDRTLIDYWDKNMSIFMTEDWKYFARNRKYFGDMAKHRADTEHVREVIYRAVKGGYACAKDLGLKDKVDWYWAPTSLARAALESMYHEGELIVHHKSGTKKYYGLASEWLPTEVLKASDDNVSDEDYYAWHVRRRIGSVGMLWNRASDAWLGIKGFGAAERQAAFEKLLNDDEIVPCKVEGIDEHVYVLAKDKGVAEEVIGNNRVKGRTEALAPLDNLLWDRRLIQKIFGFDYKWEIYTPRSQRKYGHYVLPVISGLKFVGRVELICDRKAKTSLVNGFWPEEGVKLNKQLKTKLKDLIRRLAELNGCDSQVYLPDNLLS